MDEGIRVAEDTVIPLEEIQFRASRSSGPGGQHANVTASRIEAVFDVEASDSLSEEQRDLLRRRLGDRVTAVAQDARQPGSQPRAGPRAAAGEARRRAPASEAAPTHQALPRRPRTAT